MTTLSAFFFAAAMTLFVISFFVDEKGTIAYGCDNYRMAKHYDKVSFVLSLFGVAFAIAFFVTFFKSMI